MIAKCFLLSRLPIILKIGIAKLVGNQVIIMNPIVYSPTRTGLLVVFCGVATADERMGHMMIIESFGREVFSAESSNGPMNPCSDGEYVFVDHLGFIQIHVKHIFSLIITYDS